MLQRPHTPPHQRAPLSVGAQVSTHHSRIPGLPEHLWLFRWASTPCCPIAGRRAGHPAADRWALQGLRTDLPQVGAMAVTRDGVPVRCWTFAGNIADTAIIRIVVKDDLGGWNLHRMTWGTDRGFASTATGLPDLRRRAPHPRRKAPHHQLRGRRRRARSPRPLPTVAGNLRVKEVSVAPAGTTTAHATLRGLPQPPTGRPRHRRPAAARHAPSVAERRLGQLDRPSGSRRTRRDPEDQGGTAPLLRSTPAGLLRVDNAAGERRRVDAATPVTGSSRRRARFPPGLPGWVRSPAQARSCRRRARGRRRPRCPGSCGSCGRSCRRM